MKNSDVLHEWVRQIAPKIDACCVEVRAAWVEVLDDQTDQHHIDVEAVVAEMRHAMSAAVAHEAL